MYYIASDYSKQIEQIFDKYMELDKASKFIVINDTGFLPEYISSPYRFFSCNNGCFEKKDLFVNDLNIPDFWKIKLYERPGIYNLDELMARIIYKDAIYQRNIAEIEWIKDGFIYRRDCYHDYGYKYKSIFYDNEYGMTAQEFYKGDGTTMIIDQNVVSTISLINQNHVSKWFTSKREFIEYYLNLQCVNEKYKWIEI